MSTPVRTLDRAVVGPGTGIRLVELARAGWAVDRDGAPAPLPGFVGSTFGPLVAHVAGECLRQVYGQPPADPRRGERTAVVVVSARGDLRTAAAVAEAVDHARRITPLLFFQSVPNAAAGTVAGIWGLRGPVVCTSPVGDAAADALDLAELLIADGDADEALLVLVEQACLDGESDRAVALLVGQQTQVDNLKGKNVSIQTETAQAQTASLTEAERGLLPSAADVRFYAEHGWYLSKQLLTDDEIHALVSASERFYAGHRDRTLPLRPSRLAYWEPEHGPVQRHNDYIHVEDAAIARILRKPLIGAVAARLAEADEVRLFQSTLIYKPPRPEEQSNVVPWHFDKHYWSTCTSERMLTAFIPFHDCDERMGTITMVDGSHRWAEIGERDSASRHFAERDRAELEEMLQENARYNGAEVRKIPMSIPKGHMSFHHCRTYHGSGANRGDRPRRAISLHLQDGENAYRDFRLSDGTQVAYNHDVLVRRTPDGEPDYADPEFCPQLWRA